MQSTDHILLIIIALLTVALIFLFVSVRKARRSVKLFIKQLDNYGSIIDQAHDAMLVIDIADGRVLQANPSAAVLLGYGEQELAGMSLFNFHPKEYLEESSKIVADVWEKGGLIYEHIPFQTKTNTLVPVECSARVVRFAGRPAIVIYARDISERLRLERKINDQRRLIDAKTKDITDSIEYSKRIQRSVFMEPEKLKHYAPESFILFEPRDVVSGDFYWFTNYVFEQDMHTGTGFDYKKGDAVLAVAAVDCTGHGVPGAFMSIIGNTLLNQSLNSMTIDSTGKSLDYLNAELKKSLNRSNEDSPLRDGMDMSLCAIDIPNMRLEYSGANNPVYVIRGGELFILKPDKQPITASTDVTPRPFTSHVMPLQKGDAIYLFTDGFADQFGGEIFPDVKKGGKKFMNKRFREILLQLQNKTMEEQKAELYEIFNAWKGDLPQVDDVLVIGIKI